MTAHRDGKNRQEADNSAQVTNQSFGEQAINSRELEARMLRQIQEKQLEQAREICRKVANRELNRIQKMPLSELINRQRQPKPQAPPDHTKHYLKREMGQAMIDSKEDPNYVDNMADRQVELFKEGEKAAKEYRKDLRKYPILAKIKRGKLGADIALIAFALFGTVLLPTFFYRKVQENQKRITESRSVSPQVIENLDQESPIDIDSVSEQTIHYRNPERQEALSKKLEMHNKISQLRRDLDL